MATAVRKKKKEQPGEATRHSVRHSVVCLPPPAMINIDHRNQHALLSVHRPHHHHPMHVQILREHDLLPQASSRRSTAPAVLYSWRRVVRRPEQGRAVRHGTRARGRARRPHGYCRTQVYAALCLCTFPLLSLSLSSLPSISLAPPPLLTKATAAQYR